MGGGKRGEAGRGGGRVERGEEEGGEEGRSGGAGEAVKTFV